MQDWRVGQQKKAILIEAQRNKILFLGDEEAADVVIVGFLGLQSSVNKVQFASCDDL